MNKREGGRKPEELRKVSIKKDYLEDTEASCLIEAGKTKIICAATIEEKVPPFLRDTKTGWITAEYGMLPRSTRERVPRNRKSGRVYEIQRLIGRVLRSVTNLTDISGFTITIDCDVLQADGGTRTASITGGYVALYDAIQHMLKEGMIEHSPLNEFVAAVSAGVVNSMPLLDLNYQEDSLAEIDLNIAMTESLQLVEIQGTGEKRPFTQAEFERLLGLAGQGIKQLIDIQKQALFLKA